MTNLIETCDLNINYDRRILIESQLFALCLVESISMKTACSVFLLIKHVQSVSFLEALPYELKRLH